MRRLRTLRSLAVFAVLLAASGCNDDARSTVEVSDLDPAAWDQSYNDKDDAKADLGGCNGVRVPDQGDFDGRIALTFDDGPDATNTPKVIATLKEHGAPATFFVLGKATQGSASQQILKQLVDDPDFIVGNHTWSHPNMAQQSTERVISEIERGTEAIESAGGAPKFFRFPYGSSNCGTAAAVRQRGMHVTGWHIDSADWCFNAGGGRCRESTFRYVPDDMRDDMVKFVLSQVKAHNGGVLLFHDVKGYTAHKLDEVLTALAENGYTFVSLDDATTFPMLNGVDPNSGPFVGDACASTEDCGFSHRGTAAFCLTGYCSLACAGACPDRAGKAPTFCVQNPNAADGGVCVSKSSPLNEQCEALPGTIEADVERFVGASGIAASRADVCLPKPEEG